MGLAEEMPYRYLRLHPALGPALDRELSDEERSEARRAWVEAVVQLTSFLYQQKSQDAQVSATLTVLELPNLLTVLENLRRNAPAETTVDIATSLEGLLENLGRPKALARVVRVREEASSGLDEWSHSQFLAASATVDRLLEAGRFAEAVEGARRVLERCQAAGEDAYPGASYDRAVAYGLLGRSLQMGGSAEAALAPIAEARTRFQRLGEAGNETAVRMASMCVAETGVCLQALGRLEEAAGAYETSIELDEKLGNRRGAAVAKGNLGTVRMLQRRFDDAIGAYTEARATFEALEESGNVATAWHQIGLVFQNAGQPESAEKAYQRSLRIWIQRGDRPGEAGSLSQLGCLYGEMGRRKEAVQFHRQAVEIYVERNDLMNEGKGRNNIAVQLIQLQRYDAARQEILRAIECREKFGHAGLPWTSLGILHNLERAVGDNAEAVRVRERAVQVFLAYRRAGGENHSGSGRLAVAVGQAIVAGKTKELAAQITEMRGSGVDPEALPFLDALQDVLSGSRDPALASNPEMHYEAAVELTLLLEALASMESSDG